MSQGINRRILLVDDTPSIHDDIRKILNLDDGVEKLDDARAAFFGGAAESKATAVQTQYEFVSAFQGKEALEKVKESLEENNPFALAFVDVRMPPGWDGIETVSRIWEVDPNLEIVICTAFSDYSWDEARDILKLSERWLLLKKPFDMVEIQQLANSLTNKWSMAAQQKVLLKELQSTEHRAVSLASSLETVNVAMRTSTRSAERSSERKSELLLRVSEQVSSSLSSILSHMDCLTKNEGVEEIIDDSRELMQIMNEMLDYCLVTAGKLEVRAADCSTIDLITEAVSDCMPLSEQLGIPLELRFETVIPETTFCDPFRLSQIYHQIIECGLRCPHAEGVLVTLSLEQTVSWHSSVLACSVQVIGPDITRDHASHMLDPFRQNDSTSGVPRPGLALARQLARLVDGSLTCEFDPSWGLTLRLGLDVSCAGGVRLIEGRVPTRE